MGLFTKVGTPSKSRLAMRIEFVPKPTVHFTLDQGDTNQTWCRGVADCDIETNINSLDDAVQQVLNGGLDVVRAAVPSLQETDVKVRLHHADGQTEVIGSANVSFVKSEWDACKQNASNRVEA